MSLKKSAGGKPQLGCQTRSVSQDQVCQSKHHVQFCNLFSQPSVAGLTKPELLFYHSKNMFHLGTYGGFLVFSALDLSLGAGGAVFACAGPAIDLITDRLSLIVLFPCFRALVRPR